MYFPIKNFGNNNQSRKGPRTINKIHDLEIESPIHNDIEQFAFEDYTLEDEHIQLRPDVPPQTPIINDFTYYLTGSVIFQTSDFEPLTEEL